MPLRYVASLFLVLAACVADPPTTTIPGASASAVPASESVNGSTGRSPSAAPAASDEGAAPPELDGTWRRSFEGEPLLLTLHGMGYSVRAAGGMGAGRIFVEGDRITFSNSNRCDGTGTYIWSIEDGRLGFTLEGEDPCGRVDFLLRATFGRVDP